MFVRLPVSFSGIIEERRGLKGQNNDWNQLRGKGNDANESWSTRSYITSKRPLTENIENRWTG